MASELLIPNAMIGIIRIHSAHLSLDDPASPNEAGLMVIEEFPPPNPKALASALCLKPLSPECLLGLSRLLRPKAPQDPGRPNPFPEDPESSPVATMFRSFLTHSLGEEMGIGLFQGLKDYFSEPAAPLETEFFERQDSQTLSCPKPGTSP